MRMSAATLDLSRFPAPLAIRGIDYEGILSARLARLKSLLVAGGIAWDLDRLEYDPPVIVQQSDAYRELMKLGEINDSVRAVMIAFAPGSDLDHMAAMFGVQRMLVTAGSGNIPAVYETDTEFRRRVLLAPEAFATAGPAGAFAFHALTADARVLNVDVWTPAPGEVVIALQARAGDGLAPPDLIEAVRAYLHRSDIKPLTNVVTVQSVTNHPYSVDLQGYILPGPDPITVEGAMMEAVVRMAADRRTPARDVPRSAIIAAAQLPVVDKVSLASPAIDIAMGYGQVGILQTLSVQAVTYDG